MIDFVQRALIAGIGIAIMAGPLGSLMIWRRMAYFGDTLAMRGVAPPCDTRLSPTCGRASASQFNALIALPGRQPKHPVIRREGIGNSA